MTPGPRRCVEPRDQPLDDCEDFRNTEALSQFLQGHFTIAEHQILVDRARNLGDFAWHVTNSQATKSAGDTREPSILSSPCGADNSFPSESASAVFPQPIEGLLCPTHRLEGVSGPVNELPTVA